MNYRAQCIKRKLIVNESQEAVKMEHTVIRNEYPRPDFVRKDWQNLNGEWSFEIDQGLSGKDRGLFQKDAVLEKKILVPFCPESKLSGVENKDFLNGVWYQRAFTVPKEWNDRQILLHFGAVDYAAEIWVNGQSVGKHIGGYTPFHFDITPYLSEENIVTVFALDDVRGRKQPRGKQCHLYHSKGCDYTRTTGIWQTVWMEPVGSAYISQMKNIPDVDNQNLLIDVSFSGNVSKAVLHVKALYQGKVQGQASFRLSGGNIRGTLPLRELHLWQPGDGKLYDLELTLERDGVILDLAKSYFGMRKIEISGQRVLINGKSVFQRLVLDQGFYPDGIYTAPSEEALKQDIELSLKLGFNGARMHQKVFEPYYLYWADRLGYLVWGEYADWGMELSEYEAVRDFLPQWLESVDRDFNHPAVVGWCPFNEIQDGTKNFFMENGELVLQPVQDDDVVRTVYRMTKRVDPSRPVIDVSGFFHVETDIFDAHCYNRNAEEFKKGLEAFQEGGQPYISFNYSSTTKYQGQPYMMSEYGGGFWCPGKTLEEAWEAGRPKTQKEFLAQYEGLTTALLEHPNIFGFCYTQLYDVEQEMNGLLTYEREPKFPFEVIYRINTQKAAIED